MATSVIRAVIGKAAPFFSGQAWISAKDPSKGQMKEISINDYKAKYLLLFFYPLNFTYVCPTEIVEFSKKTDLFKKAQCQILGCSVDSHFSHMEYTKLPRKDGGLGHINFPLLSDLNKTISTSFGVLNDGGVALRGTVLIDDQQIVRHISINDLSVGRNVDEYLRLVQAFQFVKQHKEVCPSSWKPGDKGMVPDFKSTKLQSYWSNVHDKK